MIRLVLKVDMSLFAHQKGGAQLSSGLPYGANVASELKILWATKIRQKAPSHKMTNQLVVCISIFLKTSKAVNFTSAKMVGIIFTTQGMRQYRRSSKQ